MNQADDDGKLAASVVSSLYQEHGTELRRFLLGVLRDPSLVQDVLQTTFARMVERGQETRPASRKAWLFRVAYNEAMAIRRRQAVGRRVERQVAWQLETEASADQGLLQSEELARVRAAIDTLTDEQRQIVRMRIYQEKTFQAIADELGIPLGTALGRMRAAVQKLRRRLGENEAS